MVQITVKCVKQAEGAKGKYNILVELSSGKNKEEREFLIFHYFCTDIPNEGRILSAEQFNHLQAADEESRSALQAVAFLSYQDRTAGQLMEKLRQKGYSIEACVAAVRFCVEKRYIKEDEQLERLMHLLCERRLYGVRRIRQEIFAKRFDKDVVREHFDRIAEELDFEEALDRRLSSLPEDAFDAAKRKRTVASLMRYGFTYEEIQKAIRRKDH